MPSLSLCIPTYNRAGHLRQTLDSIVAQPAFQSDDVEIVISDNCSGDDTQAVGEAYQTRFPGRVLYRRTARNIGFDNFREVLSLARGDFRKLNNDTLVHKPGSLEALLRAVRQARPDHRLLLFANGDAACRKPAFTCDSIDEFVIKLSYYNTWIGAFGIWADDLPDALPVFVRERPSEIPQTHVLFRLLASGRTALVNNEPLFDSRTPAKKGGYNIAQVFGNNYLSLLENLREQNLLSAAALATEKRRILAFVNAYYFDIKRQYAFDKTGYFKWMLPFYRWNPAFYAKWLSMQRKRLTHSLKRRRKAPPETPL